MWCSSLPKFVKCFCCTFTAVIRITDVSILCCKLRKLKNILIHLWLEVPLATEQNTFSCQFLFLQLRYTSTLLALCKSQSQTRCIKSFKEFWETKTCSLKLPLNYRRKHWYALITSLEAMLQFSAFSHFSGDSAWKKFYFEAILKYFPMFTSFECVQCWQFTVSS